MIQMATLHQPVKKTQSTFHLFPQWHSNVTYLLWAAKRIIWSVSVWNDTRLAHFRMPEPVGLLHSELRHWNKQQSSQHRKGSPVHLISHRFIHSTDIVAMVTPSLSATWQVSATIDLFNILHTSENEAVVSCQLSWTLLIVWGLNIAHKTFRWLALSSTSDKWSYWLPIWRVSATIRTESGSPWEFKLYTCHQEDHSQNVMCIKSTSENRHCPT